MVLTKHDDSRKLPKPRAASESQNNSMLCARPNERDGVTASVTERVGNWRNLTPRTLAETMAVNARDGNGLGADALMKPRTQRLITRGTGQALKRPRASAIGYSLETPNV